LDKPEPATAVESYRYLSTVNHENFKKNTTSFSSGRELTSISMGCCQSRAAVDRKTTLVDGAEQNPVHSSVAGTRNDESMDMAAVVMVQKLVRKATARRRAAEVRSWQVKKNVPFLKHDRPSTNKWQVFNELDLKEEGDMIRLSHCLEKLVDEIESLPPIGPENFSSNATLMSDMINTNDVQLNVVVESLEPSANYSGPVLPPKLTTESVQDLIEALRKGQELHTKYVFQILAQTRDRLLQQPNVVRTPIPLVDPFLLDGGDASGAGGTSKPGTAANPRCTVVGDLHGQLSDLLVNGHPFFVCTTFTIT
jgi:hypothetical protein